MRVLVAEFVTAGGLAAREAAGLVGRISTPPESLLREGRAMRDAVVADLSSIDGIDVVGIEDPPSSFRSSSFSSFPSWSLGTRESSTPSRPVRPIGEAELRGGAFPSWSLGTRERDWEGRCWLAPHLAGCDAAVVIAPEFDGHLLNAHRTVTSAGVRWLGCSAEVIALCGDKWRLFEWLRERGVPTIETRLAEEFDAVSASSDFPPPWVVKPRDGAGSLGIVTVDAASGWIDPANRIVQPRIAGEALSIAALVDESGRVTLLPLATQRLSIDGRFAYEGGCVPAEDPRGSVARLARLAINAVPGLRGYVGIDVVRPEGEPHRPVVVEINPRLTTSYVGYRALARENLMRHWLQPDEKAIRWRPGRVSFLPDGRTTWQP